jgi:hypothetical protein
VQFFVVESGQGLSIHVQVLAVKKFVFKMKGQGVQACDAGFVETM